LVLLVVAFRVTLGTLLVMITLSSLVLLANGLSVSTYWTLLQPFQSLWMLLYHLVTVHMLWYAPVYAWLLLLSAWTRRTPFLWAVLPPLAIAIFEKVAFGSSYFVHFLQDRVGGGNEAVNQMQGNVLDPGMHLTPGAFLTDPGLWIGLVVAATFLILAARLRRSRGPL